MYIYYPGHVPYLLHVQVGGSSCQSRVMPRHRRGRVLACNKKKLQEAFPFFLIRELCTAMLCFRWSLRWSGWVLGFRTISLNVAACQSFLRPRNQYMHVFMFALFAFHH